MNPKTVDAEVFAAMEAEIESLKAKLDTLRTLLVSPCCENLHHPPNMRHEGGAACPAEWAVQESLDE